MKTKSEINKRLDYCKKRESELIKLIKHLKSNKESFAIENEQLQLNRNYIKILEWTLKD